MIVSLNWLKKYIDIDMPVDELVNLIGARLVEIENVIDLGAKYKDILAVKVVSCQKLEGSDHLSVTKVDDGGVAKNVDRDEKGYVQVVCGAPNIAAGQFVAWVPPESVVPATVGKPEPFILEKREIRGAISNGMIASAKELDLFDEHEGILVLDNHFAPGTLFAEAYDLDDYLLDIENKSLTHRPDCFGLIGFAREVAAIFGKSFKTPQWLLDINPDFKSVQSNDVSLRVKIDDPELSSRYLAIVMSGADCNKKSPLITQTCLARIGIRPINAVVDVTNYLMMLTGQPLHAFDYDKLVKAAGGEADIHVRAGNQGEKLELLDGKNIELTPDDIVISAGSTAIGLAGAMGGMNTEIDENTKNIIIEAATFNLYNLRSTQMRHGIFSEAITRFTKGQPAGLSAPVLNCAVKLMAEWAGAVCSSNLAEAYPGQQLPINIEFTTNKINDILGGTFTSDVIVNTLTNVEFKVERTGDTMTVTPPYWRADIHILEDIVEEIGRLNGFDNIEPTLPSRDFTAVKPSEFDSFKSAIRKLLVRAGANEVLLYSFVHGDTLTKANQDLENSYKIVNSISPKLQYYRQSLTPSLLDSIHPNVKQGYDKFALFEINKTHPRSSGLTNEGVPVELDVLSMVVTDKNTSAETAYYQAKRLFEYVCGSVGLQLKYEPFDQVDSTSAEFEPKRSATVIDPASKQILGVLGEYKNSVVKQFKLPAKTAGLEVNLQALFDATCRLGLSYKPLSRFPSTDRDICFKVQQDVTYDKIIDAINSMDSQSGLQMTVSPIDIYQSEGSETKNITVRIQLIPSDHTLNNEETNTIIDSMISVVSSATGAVIV